MTTTEIIKIMAKRFGITEKSARIRLRQKLEQMTQHIRQQGSLDLPGLGTLGVNTIKAHRAYNPAKRSYTIRPESKRVSLKTEAGFRDHLRQKRNQEHS